MKKITKVDVILDLKEQSVVVYADNEKATTILFVFDGTQIRVTDVTTEDLFQRKGFGRLAFDALKMVATQRRLPIYLWSLEDAIPFYVSIGFLHLDNPKVQERVEFGNLGSKIQIEHEIDETHLIWIPKRLKDKPLIYV
jgi:hypothetical protein